MTNERQEAFDKVREAVVEAKKKGLSDEAIFQATEAGKAEAELGKKPDSWPRHLTIGDLK
jgi:hypothetical protein